MSDDWNDGYITEGCDRLHIIEGMMLEYLDGHPAIVKSEASEKINEARNLLHEAYQMVGALEE